MSAVSPDLSAVKDLATLQANHFSSRKEKDISIRMAYLAQLMYTGPQDPCKLRAVSDLFPRCLTLMPSPKDVGIELPYGLSVQAFRHGDEVIIGIRGTELNKEPSTKVLNLLADMGIGRHKTDDDLLQSIQKVGETVAKRYGYNLKDMKLEVRGYRIPGTPDSVMNAIERVIRGRIHGHREIDRALDMATGIATGAASGCATAVKYAGTVLAVVAVATGLWFAAPVVVTLQLVAGTTALTATAGATVGAATALAGSATAADGYPVLTSYVKTIDEYISRLQNRKIIKDSDTVVTVGHSLGGFLSGLVGAVRADEIYAFNGPGVDFELDTKIYKDLGLERRVGTVDYHSLSMEGDFIGHLARRSCSLMGFEVPIAEYGSPLAHHGIKVMLDAFEKSSVSSVPKRLLEDYTDPDSRTLHASLRSLDTLRLQPEELPVKGGV